MPGGYDVAWNRDWKELNGQQKESRGLTPRHRVDGCVRRPRLSRDWWTGTAGGVYKICEMVL